MQTTKPPLTNHRYGGHSAVSADHRKQQYEEVGVAHESMSPTPPYAPSGGNEPVGVAQHGMYGTSRARTVPGPPLADPTGPITSPASLGQFNAGITGQPDTGKPLSEIQRIEVLSERLMSLVNPHTVDIRHHDGMWVLKGRVRDAETRTRIEVIAKDCLGTGAVRNELQVDWGP